jgi:hypothetical protein
MKLLLFMVFVHFYIYLWIWTRIRNPRFTDSDPAKVPDPCGSGSTTLLTVLDNLAVEAPAPHLKAFRSHRSQLVDGSPRPRFCWCCCSIPPISLWFCSAFLNAVALWLYYTISGSLFHFEIVLTVKKIFRIFVLAAGCLKFDMLPVNLVTGPVRVFAFSKFLSAWSQPEPV